MAPWPCPMLEPVPGMIYSEVEAAVIVSPKEVSLCDYVIGDMNGDGSRIGSDVTYGVRYFKGIGNRPPDSCYNDSVNTTRGHWLYVGVDCNGDCNHSGADITRLVAYFKGYAHLQYCRFFPTALPPVLRDKTTPMIRFKE